MKRGLAALIIFSIMLLFSCTTVVKEPPPRRPFPPRGPAIGCKDVWIPGHYKPGGRWIRGHWEVRCSQPRRHNAPFIK